MNIEKRKALGVKLMIARKAKRLTQTAVAEKIGVHQTHYQRMERGKLGISAEQLIILCYYLNVNLETVMEIYVGVAARYEDSDTKIKKLKVAVRVSSDEIN